MIKIRNESDFRNWFKKNYGELGFSKIIKSLKINNGTTYMALLNLTAEGKINKIKKAGVNLWMVR